MSRARSYYNESNPKVAAWLRELIADGLIATGDVDDRDIRKVRADDFKGYTQCHFFAGIGGWSLALRIAGWPDDRPVWTGSCPCQDFSHCGKQAGFEGDRDLWPAWFRLIRKRKPDGIFGEQVDDSPEWWDRAAADLESIRYAAGSVHLSARAAGAKHERCRLYFFAHTTSFNGLSYDRVEPGQAGRSSAQSGGLSGLHVAGRWWRANERAERLPTLVRNFNGLSEILGGFGNAIVPQVAAEFIHAACFAPAKRRRRAS